MPPPARARHSLAGTNSASVPLGASSCVLRSTNATARSACAANPALAPARFAPADHAASRMDVKVRLRSCRSLSGRACGRTQGGLPMMRWKPESAATSAKCAANRNGRAAPSWRWWRCRVSWWVRVRRSVSCAVSLRVRVRRSPKRSRVRSDSMRAARSCVTAWSCRVVSAMARLRSSLWRAASSVDLRRPVARV